MFVVWFVLREAWQRSSHRSSFATRVSEITPGDASVLFLAVQTRRAEHEYEPAEGRRPPATGPGASTARSPPSRLEWVCHRSGTDRVYINHREHYVWPTLPLSPRFPPVPEICVFIFSLWCRLDDLLEQKSQNHARLWACAPSRHEWRQLGVLHQLPS